MGQRGPLAKPSAVRIAEGLRAHRPLNPDEPHPRAGIPEAPGHLNAAARRNWDRLIDILTAMVPPILTEADGDNLALLCQHLTICEECSRKMRSRKFKLDTIENRTILSAFYRSTQAINRLTQHFGLSPAARARLRGETGDAPASNARDPMVAIRAKLADTPRLNQEKPN